MDPNVTLAELRAAIHDAQKRQDADTDHPSFCVVPNDIVSAIIEHFGALDEWLSRGGFLPADWQRGQ